MMTTLKELQQDVAAGKYGAGYIGLVDNKPTFIPMPNGRFHVEYNPTTGVAKGRYYTPEENAKRDAEEAAYEPIRLASLKAQEMAQAIQDLAPQLRTAFASLTKDEQVEFAGDFDTVERRLNNGDVEFARAIIAAKKPQTENGIAVQAAMVTGLDNLLVAMGA